MEKTDITSDILDIFQLPYVKNSKDVRDFLKKLLSPPPKELIDSAINKLHL